MFTLDPMMIARERVRHLGTPDRYAQPVAKPRYSPPNADVAARIERVVALHRRQQEIEAEYKQALAEITRSDGDAVPIAYIATQLGVERKTIYRHLGRSMT
jgi:hypothetical protein